MNIVIDFLDDDAIENVITCLHYKFDKVIFLGDEEKINKYQAYTKRFLTEKCNVSSVEFAPILNFNFDTLKDQIEDIISLESYPNNKLFFDLTGGDDLTLVAFGIVSSHDSLPMHKYDIESDELIELNNIGYTISDVVPKQDIKLDLDAFITMQGGVINHKAHKNLKNPRNPELEPYIEGIWNASKKYADVWNSFSGFVRNKLNDNDGLTVNMNPHELRTALINNGLSFNTPRVLFDVLDELKDVGALENVKHSNGRFTFKYKNLSIKECIFDGGCILELHTYLEEKKNSDYCEIGVHIDWDGVIHDRESTVKDVLNEIDVLSITDNIPNFISCKSGKMTSGQALTAMYELSVVAKRFGGKYAKMTLAVSNPLRDVDISRAKEMGIKIVY